MKFKSLTTAAMFALSATMTLWSAPAAFAAGTDAQQIALGHKLYNAHCASCHRADGHGGVHFAHAVSADLQAPGLEHTYHENDALILRAILQARDEDGDRLDAPMPKWEGRLSQPQAEAIVAYLHTLHAHHGHAAKR